MLLLLSDVSRQNSYLQFVFVLIIFIFVLAITLYVTKWIANLQKNQMYCKNFDIIETYKIAPTKYLQIVKAGSKYLVIAVCKETVTMLAELSEEELDSDLGTENLKQESFSEILRKIKDVKSKK